MLASPMRMHALEAELRSRIEGEVRFDAASRALYSTDASNYRQVPMGVVIPRHEADVIAAIEICRKNGAPVLSRGGGTSLAGQCCNVAVVLDFSKHMNRVSRLDPTGRVAVVQPGTILDDLRGQAERFHLTFGPDPSTHTHCTLGGMIGNNSCGVHAQMAGRTSDNVHELDVVLYDGTRMRVGQASELELARMIREGGRKGQVYSALKDLRDRYASLIRERYPKIPRRISGYNLDELLPEKGFNVARALVGSEGTCVTVLEATVRLVYSPPYRVLVVLGYDDVYSAGDHVPEVLEHKPIGLEGLDGDLVDFSIKKGLHPDARKELPEGNGWLLAQFGGNSQAEASARANRLIRRLASGTNQPQIKIIDDRESEKRIWLIRESGLGATARAPGQKDTWEGWEDSAVPPERVGPYLRDLRALLRKHGYECALYGHFGQGCIHTRIDFDFETVSGIKTYRRFMDEATDLVLKHGGSLSGEHGDGQSRAEFLHKMFGSELVGAFREFKRIWDPDGKMNPGKVVDAYKIDENLRLGTTYSPNVPKTHFKFPDDKGSMPYATLRCVGVGKCRRLEGGMMCPSFMATREEKHSTRGRAHLLFELFQKDVLKEGWKSEGVKDALDLCLSCKGCKGECPVNVDMATYKAEFLSHYYKGRPRPRTAYAMGLIDIWAALASRAPRLVNFVVSNSFFSPLAKRFVGIAPQRQIPRFADETFKSWFARRTPMNAGSPEVVLWADTFNNHFHPEIAKAAVEVLEAVGYRVVVLGEHLCCGRPLYDYGMLDLAKLYLRRVLYFLKPYLENGTPIVGLEPSCVSVFRDELRGLFPNDIDADRLRTQVYMLSEFLEKKAGDVQLPRIGAKAIVHGHCHHKAVLDFKAETRVLERMGIEVAQPDPGCCGMAGSFGFEQEHERYEVAMKIGERKLLPAVRAAAEDALILANGFSCGTQIEQGTGRRPLHFAQVLADAFRLKAGGFMKEYFDVSDVYVKSLEKAWREQGGPSPIEQARILAEGKAISMRHTARDLIGEAKAHVQGGPYKYIGVGVALALAGIVGYRARKRSAPIIDEVKQRVA